jgi:transposase
MAKIHFRSYNPNQIVLFPQRIDENIPSDNPVRILNAMVDTLNLSSFHKLYKEQGRSPYDPRMMLKAVLYAYMNNIYSCRKIEKSLLRDIHFIWLAGYEKPDYRTINRFRNRVKDEINGIFTQIVLILASKGFISLDVEYVDGTKIESKANRYTFVWRKNVERNRARLLDPKFFGVSGSLGYNIEVDGNTETFTCAQVRPTTTSDLEDYLMVPYGKVCHINSFHKTFGFKMFVIA